MLAATANTSAHWIGFIGLILVFLALDLGVFHRKAHVVSTREALIWTTVWVTMAMLFASLLGFMEGPQESFEFITGYVVELSLSMDNVFVIALIFKFFGIPREHQHRVLFWGIIGALIMRGTMIWLGVGLVSRYWWILPAMGAFLVYSGIKLLFHDDDDIQPERNPLIRLARRYFPVSDKLDGQRFLTTIDGVRALTPLALVLLMVETTDLIFAVDSIPAIFGVTHNSFIIFTSNVFAILGLRSLFFALSNALGVFRYLNYGLCLVLVFVGVKMLLIPLPKRFHIPSEISLVVIGCILLASIGISMWVVKREQQGNAEE